MYTASIVFNSTDDYGATISFGVDGESIRSFLLMRFTDIDLQSIGTMESSLMKEVIREIEAEEGIFSEARLIGRLIGKYQLGINDIWYSLRIDEMIKTGCLEIVEETPAGEAVYRRKLKKCFLMAGGNRVSLSVTLFQGEDGVLHLSAITAGGSQALFFKVNTWGEEAFLDRCCFS